MVPPERFYVDPDAENLEQARFTADVTYLTYSEMRDLGFEEEQLDSLSTEKIGYTDYEEHARETLSPLARDDDDYYRLFEVYLRMDYEGIGNDQLYQIAFCDEKVLSIQEVDKHPYFAFTPFPLPHQVYGLSLIHI